jgi:hypothetical protein
MKSFFLDKKTYGVLYMTSDDNRFVYFMTNDGILYTKNTQVLNQLVVSSASSKWLKIGTYCQFLILGLPKPQSATYLMRSCSFFLSFCINSCTSGSRNALKKCGIKSGSK